MRLQRHALATAGLGLIAAFVASVPANAGKTERSPDPT
jgi:hypothetical protein